MNKLKFFISWLLASLSMFALSFVWHGIILNDFSRVSFPQEFLLILFGIVYLVLGFLMTYFFMISKFHSKAALKGLMTGSILGFLVFLVAFVLGISFYSSPEPMHLILNFCWQMFEQGVGGMIGAAVYYYMMRQEKLAAI